MWIDEALVFTMGGYCGGGDEWDGLYEEALLNVGTYLYVGSQDKKKETGPCMKR